MRDVRNGRERVDGVYRVIGRVGRELAPCVLVSAGQIVSSVSAVDDDGDVGEREGAANVKLSLPPPAYHNVTKSRIRIGENEFGLFAPGTTYAGN